MVGAFVCTVPAAASAGEEPGSANLDCLLWYGQGCDSIRDHGLCLSTRDGRPWHDSAGVPLAGQPCVWHRNGTGARCMPHGLAKEEVPDAAEYTTAGCGADFLARPEEKLSTPPAVRNVVFEKVRTGGQLDIGQACRATHITDSGSRQFNYYWVYTATSLEQCMAFCSGSPICTGVEYTAEKHYCEVWWKQIQWSEAKRGSQCYVATETGDQTGLDCLEWPDNHGGCPALTDEQACLRSRDSREVNTSVGLRIHGEPCIWCGGQPCTSNSATHVCEPYDWLLRGESKAFASLRAFNLTVATCKKPAQAVGAAVPPAPPVIVGDAGALGAGPAITPKGDGEEDEDGGFVNWKHIVLGVLLACCCGSALAYLLFSNSGRGSSSKKKRKEKRGSTEEMAPMLQREGLEPEETADIRSKDHGFGPPEDRNNSLSNNNGFGLHENPQLPTPGMPAMPMLPSLFPSYQPSFQAMQMGGGYAGQGGARQPLYSAVSMMEEPPRGMVNVPMVGPPMVVNGRRPTFLQPAPMPMAQLQVPASMVAMQPGYH